MATNKVTCRSCGGIIDKNKDFDWTMPKPRFYYHTDCYKQMQEENDCIQEIHLKAKEFLGSTYSKTKVTRQIKKYTEDGHSPLEIYNALVYWYEIKKNSAEKANGGIGILEYIWDEVENYYTKKADIKKHNLEVNEKDLFEPKVFTFRIKEEPVKKPKRVKLFSIK